jgi:glucokinase
MRSADLGKHLNIPAVRLVNDFQAVGYGIDALADDDFLTLQAGEPAPRGPRAILGAGTGLGTCIAYWAGDHYETVASEGGHADFAPADKTQLRLWHCLHEKYGHVSWERLVSGPGLVNIFQCLRHDCEPGDALAQALADADDPAAVISRFALEHRDPLAGQALDLFVTLYGAQAGNLALTVLATGGVYVAGGIAPKIRDALTNGRFLQAFTAKGRMGGLLQQIPVRVVLNPQVGLLGARLAAVRLATNNA